MVMNKSIEPVIFDVDVLRDFTEEVFKQIGVPPEDVKIAADVLIEADLRGFDSHGVARLFPCYNRIKKGLIETNPKIEIKWLTPTTGYCNGGNGLGMVVGWHAMKACLMKAKEFGSAFLTVNRSNHFGIAGYYSSMALDWDMIGIAMSNASPRVVPTGGTTGILGTNPISVAIPRKGNPPFILDMSTSAVSSGNLDVFVRKGMEIPEGWVYPSIKPFLDAEGVVPMSVLQYPLGGKKITSGYKGYGLALMVDILSGVLSGANFGSRLAASKKETEANIGHFFGAMQITGFRGIEKFNKDFDSLIQDIKSSPPEPGVEKILIPGEPEILNKKENYKKGIPLLPTVLDKLKQIGFELNIQLPR
jgi:LDH2 family malate/lactate/ureidoglycolate dehydrogenase